MNDIAIGRGLLYSQASYLHRISSSFALIADDKTVQYAEQLQSSLGEGAHLITFPAGERHKTRATKEHLEDQLFAKGLGRDVCVIGVGGGVVTDIAGYLAATYCRGVPLVLIPTSLLAMVDAAIGGKNGVNTPHGKNLVGSIYQPKKVVIDLDTLATLPEKELANGFVEMIKLGAITDLQLFENLEKRDLLEKLIRESCVCKMKIVSEDERERGKRQLLNFGHTIGHALEKLSNYELPHGEAVAIGLVVESFLSVHLGALHEKCAARIRNLLAGYGLPLQLPCRFSEKSLLDAMVLDKKSLSGRPRFVALEAIGRAKLFGASYCTTLEESLLKEGLQWMNDALYCN